MSPIGAGFDHIALSVDAGVAVLTLNRPAHRNAWIIPMVHELSGALRRCDADDHVRAVVITGAGRSFSVGADLRAGDIAAPGSDEQPVDVLSSLFTPRHVRKPVIAAMNGDAIGMGVTLSLHCDLRIVAQDARLAMPMVRLGVIPEMGAHWTLARIAGAGVAADLLLTGRRFSGAEAVTLGVCGEAVPRRQVLARAMEVATDIATHVAPRAAAVTKRLLQRADGMSFDDLMTAETELFARVAQEPDASEGVAAFLERRPPRWTGVASTEPTWTAAETGP